MNKTLIPQELAERFRMMERLRLMNALATVLNRTADKELVDTVNTMINTENRFADNLVARSYDILQSVCEQFEAKDDQWQALRIELDKTMKEILPMFSHSNAETKS